MGKVIGAVVSAKTCGNDYCVVISYCCVIYSGGWKRYKGFPSYSGEMPTDGKCPLFCNGKGEGALFLRLFLDKARVRVIKLQKNIVLEDNILKKKILCRTALLLAVCCVLTLLCGCGKSDIEKAIEEYAVEYTATQNKNWQSELGEEYSGIAQLVVSSSDAFNSYDTTAYMNCIHPESPVHETTYEDIKWIAGYALKTEIEDVSVLWCNGDNALVGITQLTYQVGEARFEYITTRTAAIHLLVCENDRWYFVESAVVSDTKLSGELDPFFEIVDDFS